LLIDTSARFVFLAGKGGVGKSTAACTLALQLADAGRPTRLFSTDPAHSLKDVLGGENCSDLLAIEEFDANAFAENWLEEARSVLTDLIERGTYLDASDAGSFLDLSLPGVDEVMAAFRLVELEKTSAERIVVDTAPTGHTLRLLAAADVIESWMPRRPPPRAASSGIGGKQARAFTRCCATLSSSLSRAPATWLLPKPRTCALHCSSGP
jgi:arsenite/tail-anchored protein-transporting ATPase